MHITEQIRDFFLNWTEADIIKTVVPAKTAPHHTNQAPPLRALQKTDMFMFDEFFAPTRRLVEFCGGPGTEGRPRPVFLDSDVALTLSLITTFAMQRPRERRCPIGPMSLVRAGRR